MSAYNTTLLDEDNNEIYPKTLAENVYDGNVRMDQKVDGIRTDLGSPSSASSVTGADAFSKISKLNSDLTPQFEAMYSNTIMMVRMGKIRMMYAIGNYVTVPLTSAIPSGDRPQHQVQGVLTTQGSDKAYIIRLSIQGVIDILLNGSVVTSVNNAAFFLVWCVS